MNAIAQGADKQLRQLPHFPPSKPALGSTLYKAKPTMLRISAPPPYPLSPCALSPPVSHVSAHNPLPYATPKQNHHHPHSPIPLSPHPTSL